VRRVVADAGDANAAANAAAAKGSRTQRRDGRQVLGLLRLSDEVPSSRRSLELERQAEGGMADHAASFDNRRCSYAVRVACCAAGVLGQAGIADDECAA